MKIIAVLFISIFFAQACTSVNQPTASRPLVEEQFTMPTSMLDSQLSDVFTNAAVGDSFTYQSHVMVMGNKFFAAIGLTCRKVKLLHNEQSIYCQNQTGIWFKVNKVISEYSDEQTQEVEL